MLNWCRRKRQSNTTPPFYIYCTGGAGVGKSHLINAVVQMANRELRQPGDNPDDAIVIITAPTGTAAYNVSGCTLHSTFMMSAKSSDKLSAERLTMLRNKYHKLVLVIIDEVSMVGANLLKRVHERFAAIRGLPSEHHSLESAFLQWVTFSSSHLSENLPSTKHRGAATPVLLSYGCLTSRLSN